MRRQVYRIDEYGYFVEPVLILDTDDLPEDCVIEFPTDGLYKAQFVAGEWIEGLSPEEVSAIEAERATPTEPELSEVELLQAEIESLKEQRRMTDLTILELSELVLGGI